MKIVNFEMNRCLKKLANFESLISNASFRDHAIFEMN